MTDCVFCSIATGTIPSFTVYEDIEVIAFMDKNPINRGHVLVIPKVHQENLEDLSESVYSKVTLVARRLARAIHATFLPKKVGFAVAGFDVPHAHLHLIPMHDYHDLTSKHYLEGTLKKPTQDEMKRDASRIHQKIIEQAAAENRSERQT